MTTTALRVEYIARYHCGCVYRTRLGRAPICPKHRMVLTGEERIRYTGENLRIQNAAKMTRVPQMDQMLRNDQHNSLTRFESVGSHGQGYGERDVVDTGICNACYLEDDSSRGSGITICGCSNEDCKYRWCGRTQGLHAFHRMHVEKEYPGLADTEEEAQQLDKRIFPIGEDDEVPRDWKDALERERDWLDQRSAEATEHLARMHLQRGTQKARIPGLVASLEWLEKLNGPPQKRALTWLICTGAIRPPPAPPEDPMEGQLQLLDHRIKTEEWLG